MRTDRYNGLKENSFENMDELKAYTRDIYCLTMDLFDDIARKYGYVFKPVVTQQDMPTGWAVSSEVWQVVD